MSTLSPRASRRETTLCLVSKRESTLCLETEEREKRKEGTRVSRREQECLGQREQECLGEKERGNKRVINLSL